MNNKAEALKEKIERILETAYFPEGGYEPDAPDEILALCSEVAREAVSKCKPLETFDWAIDSDDVIDEINKAFGVSDVPR